MVNKKLASCSSDRDVHNLVIRSACHAHGGVYKAVISNKVGKAACYAHLYVTGTDRRFNSPFNGIKQHNRMFYLCIYLNADIVPDPPDGPPVIEAITGKTISLSWKRPKRPDPSFGGFPLIKLNVFMFRILVLKERVCLQMSAPCSTWSSSNLWAPSSGPSWPPT